jgi:hypothetical protein
MALSITIDVILVAALVVLTLTKGFERTLPLFAFLVIVLPEEARIGFGDLFVLTSARIVIAMLVVLYILFGSQLPQSGGSNSLPLKYLLILYLGWCMVSTLNSIVFTVSLKNVLSYALEFYVVYYIVAKSVSSVETVHKILAAMVAALVVCCVFGFVERFTGWKVSDLFPTVAHRLQAGVGGRMPNDPGRVKSTFPVTILFGNGLALGIPWALYLLNLANTAARKAYLWVAIIMMSWNIYRTLSRGSWMGLAVTLFLLFVFSQGSIRKYLMIVSLLIVVSLVARPGVWDTLRSTYSATEDPHSARGMSYHYRYDLMRAAGQALAKDPIRAVWGFGPESFYFLGLEGEISATGHPHVFDSCDSAFVEVALDTGYVGLLLVVALLIRAVLWSLKGFMSLPPPANFLCLVFLGNILAYAVMMLSVQNFGWGQQTLMLWILIALSVAYRRLAEAENVAQTGAVVSLGETRPHWAHVAPL